MDFIFIPTLTSIPSLTNPKGNNNFHKNNTIFASKKPNNFQISAANKKGKKQENTGTLLKL